MAGLAERIGAIDPGERRSLYRQLQDTLRRAIGTGILKPQEALPAERDLAAGFGVSRITVRKALDTLVAEGLLIRRQGAGTFVAGRVEKQFAKLSSFSEDMAARGRTVRSDWLTRSEGQVSPDEALTLGLSPGSRIFRLNRIRFADDLPMALEYSTISGFGLDGPESVADSLYAALEAKGNRPVRALQRLRAILFNAEQAALLGVALGAPGLLIERRGFLEDGRPIEATRSFYRGDAYDFVAELTTGAAG
jgi:GntR family transcriptional regulator